VTELATELRLPSELLPRDGRFGSGPSKVPAGLLADFAAHGPAVMGTSHRQAPVKQLVARVRSGLAELFAPPAGYQVVLGNGGSTAFWDAAAFGLILNRSQHVHIGEFSAKFTAITRGAPFLDEPSVRAADPGQGIEPVAEDGIDAYCWPQNETSTGVVLPVRRTGSGLQLVDATSAAAGIAVELAETDAYYFAPQKGFAGDGGLWLALLSPAAIERITEVKETGRWIPPSLDLLLAVQNSAKDQTYNTPAVATLYLLAARIEQLLAEGGLPAAIGRSAESARRLYGWAEAAEFATPFVTEAAYRSPVVGTIDFAPEVDAGALARALRANGVVDTEPYRGLARNQLRIGMYPAVDPDDVSALTACIDWLVPRLG